MVSKTLLVACVALLCAQAFAYPREKNTFHGSLGLKCLEDIAKSVFMIKDFGPILDDFVTIVTNTAAAKAACSDDACKKAADNKEVDDFVAEVAKVGHFVEKNLPVVQELLDGCF